MRPVGGSWLPVLDPLPELRSAFPLKMPLDRAYLADGSRSENYDLLTLGVRRAASRAWSASRTFARWHLRLSARTRPATPLPWDTR